MSKPEYNSNQSRDERSDAATQRIKEKVAVLEVWKQNGVPDDYGWTPSDRPDERLGCPYNLDQFHRWEDEDLQEKVLIDDKELTVMGVYKFSAVTLNKPKHSALKDRAITLMDRIRNRPTPKKENVRLRYEINELQSINQRLVNENIELRSEIMALEEDLETVTTERRLISEQLQDANRKLRKISPLHVGPVK